MEPDHEQTVAPPRNVVLTGFMGTGKSTVGKILAQRLGLKHVDTDHLIERRHGPIPRIFEAMGEDGFRTIEREVADELALDEGYVISTGGRFLLDPHNAAALTKGNRVFCLVAELEIIFERVMRRRGSRPMLAVENPRERIAELLAERAEGYAKFESIRTDERPPTQVVSEIVRRLDQPPPSPAPDTHCP